MAQKLPVLTVLITFAFILSGLSNQWNGDLTTLPSAESREPRRVEKRLVTFYSSTPDQTDDTPFITANGTRVRDGIAAANFLPFGARFRLPELFGGKVFVVHDRMHARFQSRIDIWVETREEAIARGVEYTRVEIY